MSAFGNDFNYDYHVCFTDHDLKKGKVLYNFTETAVPAGSAGTELPGLSSFYKDDTGEIFHTYSSHARGGEELIGTHMILDRAPKGRNEKKTMDFLRRHDEYETTPKLHDCFAYIPQTIRTCDRAFTFQSSTRTGIGRNGR